MNHCRDCKHWKHGPSWNAPYVLPAGTREFVVRPGGAEATPIKPRPWGICAGTIGKVRTFPSCAAETETHEEFGCVQWEAK